MLKCIYAHTAAGPTYPPYVNFSCGPDGDQVSVTLRDAPQLVQTENGGHFEPGHTSATMLTREQALDLADSITKHYREVDGIEGESLRCQVSRLAEFIISAFEGEPSESAGAIDTAIRLLGDYAATLKVHKIIRENLDRESAARIAAGLRKGQAKHIMGETQDVTTATAFVNAGTKARAITEEEIAAQPQKPPLGPIPADIAAELAARDDGSNEPASHSAPLGAMDVVGPQPGGDETFGSPR